MTTIHIGTAVTMIFSVCSMLCTGGALLLLFRPGRSRSQKLLGFILLFWGINYTIRGVATLFNFVPFVRTDLLDPVMLFSGNLFAIILLLYPLEIVRPGWINLRHFLMILSPLATIAVVYYGGMALLGQTARRLLSMNDLTAHLSQFNVWFRMVVSLSMIIYILALLRLVYKYEVNYRRWCEENYSSTEQMDIAWLRYFGIGVGCITMAYQLIIFIGHTWCFALHKLTVFIVFTYTLYFGLFHKNPYPDHFFSNPVAEEDEEEPSTEASFKERMPEYIETVKEWFDREQPYLRPEFKLTDLIKILPLNRSYLSRIFNLGMGDTFNNVVRNYRMKEARKLLIEHPELSIREISERCGYSSSTVFHRTFRQCNHQSTPGQFRENKGIVDPGNQ